MKILHPLWLALACTACSPAPQTDLAAPAETPATTKRTIFTDSAAAAGLDFYHANGASGEYYFPEIMGAGVAVLDYDNDGDLDVFAVQGKMLDESAQALFALPETHVPGHRLFRNELIPEGALRFTDVSDESGVSSETYGMGVATGDYDNDGDVDIYVANVGSNTLLRNDGAGAFSDVTTKAGVGDERWSVSASFFDYDRDGDLDLFVANYVSFYLSNTTACRNHAGHQDYCDPTVYKPARDRLYRNDGNGRFSDVTAETGLDAAFGNGLGVTAADFDLDGWPDLYVANDKMANQLWMNRGDGRFVDRALIAGAAYNADGAAEASMGVTAGDYDSDGDDDLFLTHLGVQTNTLYSNDGEGSFVDVTEAARLAIPSLGFTGFGTEWFDVDNDGRLDLFSANGAVAIETDQMGIDPYPYRQADQLFRNAGAGRFEDLGVDAALGVQAVSRGAAFGDIDNDGDLDIVVSNNNGPLRLLINEIGNEQHWLALRLLNKSNRDAIGARVAVLRAETEPLWRRVHTDGSYASASDPRLHVGLGGTADPVAVEVTWPDGSRERWTALAADTLHVLTHGGGTAVGP
ncbi:MAG: CRTAC1 family protein [Gammaproteobacteria bacterium]|nr:CRTAC1 family protein [Gammaproteobacteria bacterium]